MWTAFYSIYVNFLISRLPSKLYEKHFVTATWLSYRRAIRHNIFAGLVAVSSPISLVCNKQHLNLRICFSWFIVAVEWDGCGSAKLPGKGPHRTQVSWQIKWGEAINKGSWKNWICIWKRKKNRSAQKYNSRWTVVNFVCQLGEAVIQLLIKYQFIKCELCHIYPVYELNLSQNTLESCKVIQAHWF